MQKVYSNGISIEVETFNLENKGASYKLDLLYYNKINRYGDVLTSLVFNSGVKSADDVGSITYDPNRLFNNTTFERSYVINEVSYIWKNSYIRSTKYSILKDNSYSANHKFKKFNVGSDYAVESANGEYAYDGWYTIVSLGLANTPYNATVPKGTIKYDSSLGYAEYSKTDNPLTSSDWESLEKIDATVPIYNLTKLSTADTFTQEDFAVTVKVNSLYKQALDKSLDNEWFSYVNVIRTKLQTIEFSIENKIFEVAQHIIQSMNNSLITLLT